MYRTLFNATDAPIPLDDQGHVVGGREFASADPTTTQAEAAIASGSLVLIDEDSTGGLSREAADAIDRTATLNRSAESPTPADEQEEE